MTILTCTGCGATKSGPTGDPTDLFPSTHCGDCPPWRCEDCGATTSSAKPCPCWVQLDGLPLADIKALFAAVGSFSIGGLGPAPEAA